MNLLNAWPVLVFGWGPIIVALGLALFGLFLSSPRLMLAAGIVSIPPALVIAGSPATWWAAGFPLLLIAAYRYLKLDRPGTARGLTTVFAAGVLALAWRVVW